MKRLSCFAVALLAVGSFASPTLAADREDGWWLEVAPGLLEHVDDQGTVYRRAVGKDGLQAMLAGVEERLTAALVAMHERPSERRAEQVRFYEGRIAALEAQILDLELNPRKAAASLRAAKPPACIQNWNASVSAGCFAQSASAVSSSTGGGSCPTCALSTYVEIERENCSNIIQGDSAGCFHGGTNNGNCNRSVTFNFSTPSNSCYSYAEASITCPSGPVEEMIRSSNICNCTIPPC